MKAKLPGWEILTMLLLLLGRNNGQSLLQIDELSQVHVSMANLNKTSLDLDVNMHYDHLDWLASLGLIAGAMVPILIPEEAAMAAAIGVMVSVFWPETGEEDIWTKIEPQVQDLVDTALLEQELKDRQAEIDGILKYMKRYIDAKTHEKASMMSAVLLQCDITNSRIKENEQSHVHTIGMTITLAYIHLNMLRERLVYGTFMYDEDNSEVWQRELEEEVVSYQHYLSDAYKEWQDWRKGQIDTRAWVDGWPFGVCLGLAEDHLTGLKVEFSENTCTVNDYFGDQVRLAKTYFFNEPRGQFMRQLYQASFELIRFIPGKETHLPYALPQDRELEFGPYNPYILQYIADSWIPQLDDYIPDPHWDAPESNVLTEIVVSAFDYIDGLKFTYEDYQGRDIGRLSENLHEFSIDGLNVTLTNVTMGYGSWLYEMELGFSDGSTTGPLGSKGDRPTLDHITAGNIGPRFKCINIGSRGAMYVGTMWLMFKHDVPDDEFTKSLADRWPLTEL